MSVTRSGVLFGAAASDCDLFLGAGVCVATSTIFGLLEAEAGRVREVGRFFGGRIALEMSPGADAGRNDAAALFAANGDSSSDTSRMLASFGIDSSLISFTEASSFDPSLAAGFVVDFRCATLFFGAGFFTGVEVTSTLPCTCRHWGGFSVLVSENGLDNVGGMSGVEDAFGSPELRGFRKGNSRFGGIHMFKASLFSIGVEDGLRACTKPSSL